MNLRRGFRAEAGRTATGLRQEMGLAELDRFDPFAAADYLGIPVWPFSKCLSDVNSPEASLVRSGRVSAMTIFVDRYRRVFFYDGDRSPARIASDLAHELAHAILLHPPHYFCEIDRTESTSGGAEAEAAHLSGVLLISDAAAVYVASRPWDLVTACAAYGVSREMMTWRLNATGARKRVARARRRREYSRA